MTDTMPYHLMTKCQTTSRASKILGFKPFHLTSLFVYHLKTPKKYIMIYAIWYHLHNLKNVKNSHGGVLLLVKLQASATLFKITKKASYNKLREFSKADLQLLR